jgi:hypothetical protein
MSTPTPPGDVSVTAPGCAACGAPLPAGRSRRFCSPACRQAAFRRRHQSAQPETPCDRAAHGWKAPSTNAPSARPATWPSNGAMTAQPPANALAPAVSAPAAC